MRKRKLLQLKHLIIGLLVIFSLCALGVNYAVWTQDLRIASSFTTGFMDIVFGSEKMAYRVSVLEVMGNSEQDLRVISEISGNQILWEQASDKSLKLSLTESILTTELSQPNRILALQYPLVPGEGSSIKSVALKQVDFSQPSLEQIKMEPDCLVLNLQGDINQSYGLDKLNLPPGLSHLSLPIYFDVYRQVEIRQDQLYGLVYLKPVADQEFLTEAATCQINAADLYGLLDLFVAKQEQQVDVFSLTQVPAEVTCDYTFALPVFIDQGQTSNSYNLNFEGS